MESNQNTYLIKRKLLAYFREHEECRVCLSTKMGRLGRGTTGSLFYDPDDDTFAFVPDASYTGIYAPTLTHILNYMHIPSIHRFHS